MDILKEGFRDKVRSRLGVDEVDLPDGDIDKTGFAQIAELKVKKRVPRYMDIVDETELIYLEEAAVNYFCYLMCPLMALKVNIEVKALDTSWKKDKVKWDERATWFLGEFELALDNITSVEVTTYDASIAGLITHDYEPIGGE